ncbi:hypothetical protein [Autumnicola psychrophila]|uniref:Uncharacterized protein n=1 Tax=Autumnicola psychrophila TaxID=3075592 RepID=A0ABU3DM04_9FLAO|nr:hypothetical protein [Zunongwangia sp. F225]MDT0684738.1 hypothetical protein [Zunongwangia sp. F225]
MSSFIFKYISFLFLLSCQGGQSVKNTASSDNKNINNRVWQWSVTLDGFISPETNEPPEAFLYIPQGCEKVKGVVLAQNNMIEEGVLEHPDFRNKMRELDFAEIWVTPIFSQKFDFHSQDPDLFKKLMRKLARKSGYTELESVPVIPLGHSALATFPWNFAVAFPERTLTIISIHGDAPQTTLTGYGGENVDWENKNIDGIPGLFIMGEFEWWEDRIKPGFRFQQENPGSVITWFADAGHGHFDYSDMLVNYVADYIEKASEYRLGNEELKSINPEDGWLMDRWRKDSLPIAKSATYAQFKGNKATASWAFDKEMANETEKYYNKARGKKKQFLGIKYNGEIIKPKESHANYQLEFIPMEDGISFGINAFFSDSTRTSEVFNHASTKIKIDKITGPVKKINDSIFQIHFDKLGFSNKKRSNDIWLLANNEGDSIYKSAVQQIQVRFPLINDTGNSQKIEFTEIPDQLESVKSIALNAFASSGLPVQFYVKKGPAYVVDGKLIFTQLPPRTQFPVEVEVIAWQYGVKGEWNSAKPVSRKFQLIKKI